jgi:WD repeat-containing protein 19
LYERAYINPSSEVVDDKINLEQHNT